MKNLNHDELLELSTDELYASLGGHFIQSEPVERGIKSTFESLKKLGIEKFDLIGEKIKSAVCSKKVFDQLTDDSTKRQIFVAVLDGLTASNLESTYPVATLAALIVRLGVHRICRRVKIE